MTLPPFGVNPPGPKHKARAMDRGEWLRLGFVMAILVALGLVIVFAVGDNSGTPTQRAPLAPVSSATP